jgi:hypothetical protein
MLNPTGDYSPTNALGDPARLSARCLQMSRIHLREPLTEDLTPVNWPGSAEKPEVNVPPGTATRLNLVGEIARGGIGAILMGRDVVLGRDLTVKVLMGAHQVNSCSHSYFGRWEFLHGSSARERRLFPVGAMFSSNAEAPVHAAPTV